MPPNFSIQEKTDPPEQDVAFVRKKFMEFNDKQCGVFPGKDLNLFSYDQDKKIIGGLIGDIEWGWLHIDIIWIEEAHRKKGIGTALMKRAESEAIAMGVHDAFIETTDFQAMEFYEKLGYSSFTQLENQPPGHICYYMKKTLPSPPVPAT